MQLGFRRTADKQPSGARIERVRDQRKNSIRGNAVRP